jgi:hypothetical protein
MRDHMAHRYFDTDHAVLRSTVDNDLPELERAVQAMAATLPADDQQEEDPHSDLQAARVAQAWDARRAESTAVHSLILVW